MFGKNMRHAIVGVLVLVSLSSCGAQAQAFSPAYVQAAPQAAANSQAGVTISGGYELDPRDMGRPVVLIAAGLGVPTEVFREAFSHVRPAGAGTQPSEQRVHSNKAALLKVLAPYGVTNEDLDRVSDYYRYVQSAGEMWPTTAAELELVRDANGKISAVKVINGGSGYSSTPTIRFAEYPNLQLEITMHYGKDLASNGSIAEIKVISQ